MYHIHESSMTEDEETHFKLALTKDHKKRCLFRAKLYPALEIVRNARDSCVVYSSFPLHELGRMLLEEEIPFRFIHSESTAQEIEEASYGGVILLGPRIPNRFKIKANTIVSLDTFLTGAEKERLKSLAKKYFIIISIPTADNKPTIDFKTS